MQGLSGEQVDYFLTNGYLILDNFWTKDTCHSLMDKMANLIERDAASIPGIRFSSGDNAHALDDYFLKSADKIHYFLDPNAMDAQGNLLYPLNKSINKIGHGLHHADELFKAVSFDERIKTICHQLGFESVGLLQSMYLCKQPSIGDGVSWHQDSCYLYVEKRDVIGFWFALEDASLENGCLQAIPSPDNTPLKQRMVCHDGSQEFINYHYAEFDVDKACALEVKQGSLIILHGRLPHASGPNHSPQSRHAYALHAIDTSKPYPIDNWLQWPNAIPHFD